MKVYGKILIFSLVTGIFYISPACLAGCPRLNPVSFDVGLGGQARGQGASLVRDSSHSGSGEWYKLVDFRGGIIALGHLRRSRQQSQVDVYDCNRRKIGSLAESAILRPFTASMRYTLFGSRGRKISESGTVDALEPNFEMNDHEGRRVAAFERPIVNPEEASWHIEGAPASDARVLAMMALLPGSVVRDSMGLLSGKNGADPEAAQAAREVQDTVSPTSSPSLLAPMSTYEAGRTPASFGISAPKLDFTKIDRNN